LQPLLVALAVGCALLLAGCARTSSAPVLAPPPLPAPASAPAAPLSGPLTIFEADSLAVPFKEVSTLFQQQHPAVVVQAEAAGSQDSARKISDLKRPCDVFASADPKVTEALLMPEYVDFDLRFATAEMVLAYTDNSRRAGEITAQNWPRILSRDEVILGRADPQRDPGGYRTLMTLQLAEKYYHLPGLARQLEAKGGQRFIRPAATDVLALLESGEVDYLFIYRSVCLQHGLKYLQLPPEINLSKPELADLYKTATVRVIGKKPGEYVTMTGAPLVYSVTIPTNAPHRAAAEAWVALLLGPAGQAVMQKNGQPVLAPALTDQFAKLPALLQPLCAGRK
jgi:molybdate/tungstate transport system substrate-binding protein